MTTQEMIFDYLKVQGLVPEYDEDKDTRFKINLSKKIVKAVVMGEGVFLMTEVLLDETPEPSVMVPRMLDMLVGAQQSFYDTLREM